ncbi:hypothetical protein GLYMA_04G082400v4 [Glycine max]|uniref:Uncharacterized protein n=1 Tax=Glycine max TaxID=3847 RepID=A0A0R0KG64_SOYBN|nr:hypothetical protein GYH30_009317 [Glycine max]KRH62047.1 hypothetical protein GLYMA_04G082400v4 [Glycine max]
MKNSKTFGLPSFRSSIYGFHLHPLAEMKCFFAQFFPDLIYAILFGVITSLVTGSANCWSPDKIYWLIIYCNGWKFNQI